VIICIILILAVLLQSGKAADLAGAFGGGGSATAFGPRGQASLMSKVTTISAVLFMVTSLGLWILSGHEGKSAVSGVQAPVQKTNEAPMTPAAKPPAVKTDANAAGAKTPADKPADKTAAKPPAAKAATTTPSSGQPAPQPAPKK
jgi:preprotein translocase subunit SecG